MFNMTDADTGDKVDFWLLTEDEFDRQRFAGKTVADVQGVQIKVSRPEDTILRKLKWSEEMGGSEKQFRDARSVYEIQLRALDQTYLDTWASKLGVTELLGRLRNEAQPE
jgi:hypothetical protein